MFVSNWVSPFGKIFINLLKLIAVPLVLSSLITGVASLSDLKKLSRIGGRTIAIYIATTTVAVTIGLLSVNLLEPGATVPDDMKSKLHFTAFFKYYKIISTSFQMFARIQDLCNVFFKTHVLRILQNSLYHCTGHLYCYKCAQWVDQCTV